MGILYLSCQLVSAPEAIIHLGMFSAPNVWTIVLNVRVLISVITVQESPFLMELHVWNALLIARCVYRQIFAQDAKMIIDFKIIAVWGRVKELGKHLKMKGNRLSV